LTKGCGHITLTRGCGHDNGLYKQLYSMICKSVIMCLWFVQVCPDCNFVSAIPTALPQYCERLTCERRMLNPTELTHQERYSFIEDDMPCNNYCTYKECGLMTRMILCGRLDAVRERCQHWSDTDSGIEESC